MSHSDAHALAHSLSAGARIVAGRIAIALVIASSVMARISSTHAEEFTVGGVQRSFNLIRPASTSSAAVPLILAFHGGTGWGQQFAVSSGLGTAAPARGFAIAFLEGEPTAMGGGAWNAGTCCGRRSADDVAYTRAVVQRITGLMPIDRGRIYAVGHSNGGGMAYRLACEASDIISGIAAVSSAMWVEACQPRRAVSVLHIHGSEDDRVPINGGPGTRIMPVQPPALSGEGILAASAGCGIPVRTSHPDRDITRWPCPGATRISAAVIRGQGHVWPGGRRGVSVSDYSATDEILDYLEGLPARP